MIKYVFFDLDGTLLGMDDKEFLQIYLSNLYKNCFDENKYSFKEASYIVHQSLNETINDLDNECTNLEKYYKYFKMFTDKNLFDSYLENFNNFYKSNEFDKCKTATYVNENMVKAVKYLKQKGYKLVIATNPFFPKTAIIKRLSWANLDINDFELVTFGEDSHFLKPHLEYYQEIMERLNIDNPSEILMIGNDVEEDMVSSKLGFNTYLVTDCMLSRFGNEDKVSNKGNSSEFLVYIKENL